MEDFKRIIKMKTGGSVSKAIAAYEKRERKSEEKSDMAQDKAIVKKAIAMHDKQEHPGEKTNLSKLKKGGRSKKEKGTVKKFEKASGEYGAKKDATDNKRIKEAKLFKPKKLQQGGLLQEPGKPAVAAPKMCGGGKMGKYAEGGSIDDDVRARAMKWLEAGSPDQAAAPSAAVKPSKPKAAKKEDKLIMPDYSNEDLDRMDAENAAYERKRESRSLERRYPKKRSPSEMLREESEFAAKTPLEQKGSRLLKSLGMRCGGKAKKMNTGGTCS
jgi:hypothetical protein